MSDPGTLGAAASGTCFVIFTIGLAMFTLLKSFQIIKNRKTFEHYCFSTLQRAGEEAERSGLSSSVNKWNVRAGGHLLPGAGMWRPLISRYALHPHTTICLPPLAHSALLLPSCSWISFHPVLHLKPKLLSLYLHISLYSVCSTLTNYQASRNFFGLLT